MLFLIGILLSGCDLLLRRVLCRQSDSGGLCAFGNGCRLEPGVFFFKKSNALKYFWFRGRCGIGKHGMHQLGGKELCALP